MSLDGAASGKVIQEGDLDEADSAAIDVMNIAINEMEKILGGSFVVICINEKNNSIINALGGEKPNDIGLVIAGLRHLADILENSTDKSATDWGPIQGEA